MAAIKDSFPSQQSAINAPYTRWVLVALSDATPLVELPRAIHLGGAVGGVGPAHVKVKDKDGVEAVFYMKQGDTLPIRPYIIMLNGTTTNAVVYALY